MTTLHKAVKVIADSVEKLAFEMPAPNPYTPRFVMLVIALRSALAQQGEPVAKYIGECHDGSLVQLYEDLKKGTELYTATPALAQQGEPVAWVDMADGVPTEQPRLWQEHSHDEVPLYAGAAPAAQPQCDNPNACAHPFCSCGGSDVANA